MVTTEGFIEATRLLLLHAATSVATIFLATDDQRAEGAFRAAFGGRVVVRSGMKRVGGGLNADGTLNEVHIKSPHNPGCCLDDAVDVVTDAMLLSRCHYVLHADSNVTSAVSFMNDTCKMVHIFSILASANLVQNFIQHGYCAG